MPTEKEQSLIDTFQDCLDDIKELYSRLKSDDLRVWAARVKRVADCYTGLLNDLRK